MTRIHPESSNGFGIAMRVGIEQRRPVSVKVEELFALVEEVNRDIWLKKLDLESGLYPSLLDTLDTRVQRLSNSALRALTSFMFENCMALTVVDIRVENL
jgi:hypothetical protein